jgi:FMN phosphatase YigB (HAD superfamily)
MELLLSGYDFDFFTLENSPSKTDSRYFTTLLKNYSLQPDQVVYFDHQLPALESARSVGVSSVLNSIDIDAVIPWLSTVVAFDS